MTRTRGSATWADTNPRGHLRGAQAKDKRAKLIGPMGRVGPREIKGGRARPSWRCKAIRAYALI